MYLRYRLKDFLFERKMKRQRYKRGYADVDVWNIDNWFLEMIVPMLKQLRTTKHGSPCGLTIKDLENIPINWIVDFTQRYPHLDISGDEDTHHVWFIILSRMEYCFSKLTDESIDSRIHYDHTEAKEYLRELQIITETNNKLKEEGFALMSKYFHHLWD